MKNKIDIYTPLDSDEEELLETIHNDEWIESKDINLLKKQAKMYADSTIKKDRRMNIRISERDLKNLKIIALEEGLPYQTLVSMILHKYLSGKFEERTNLI